MDYAAGLPSADEIEDEEHKVKAAAKSNRKVDYLVPVVGDPFTHFLFYRLPILKSQTVLSLP